MNKLFILLSIIIVLIISTAIVFQIRKAECTKQKGEYIKNNLPTSYGPDSFDKRQADNIKINDVYKSCLYPWK